MGQFSWLYADTGKQMLDNHFADSYLLVPPAFQAVYGKHIKISYYDGYGNFGPYQINELIAEWNISFIPEVIKLIKAGQWYGGFSENNIPLLERYMADRSKLDDQEREWVGILLSVYDENNSRLPNPIKITTKPMEYDEVGYSLSDPNQGWLSENEDEEEKKFLLDFWFFEYDPSDDDKIIVDGFSYDYERGPFGDNPNETCRVEIDGEYFYFD